MKDAKSVFLHIVLPFMLVIMLFACNTEDMGGSDIASVEDWGGKVSQVVFSDYAPMYELPDDVRTLNISFSEPSEVFLVRMNSSDTVVPAVSSQYLVETSVVDITTDGGDSSRTVMDALMEPVVSPGVDSVAGRTDFEPARDFVPPFVNTRDFAVAMRSAQDDATTPSDSVTRITPKVSETQKWLWLDLPSIASGSFLAAKTVDGKEYTKRLATLQAVGTHCYVWVVDGYFSSSSNSSNEKISSSMAQKLASQFDEVYPLVRGVFGNESDVMIDYGSFGTEFPAINSISDTGGTINIVVYDIKGDYASSAGGGTYGYFWSKDYYSQNYAVATGAQNGAIGLSNEGKYFYLDSYFVNMDTNTMFSTLAHEFQHMINFGNKTLASMKTAGSGGNVLRPATWYNEMLSMLCEDMLEEKLELDDSESPKARLPLFCSGYYRSGITDWLGGSNVLYSYAGAYTFGAYLARNFGGAAFVREIAQNSAVDKNSISQALQKLGWNETFDSVFKKYAQALVLSGDLEDTLAKVSLNKAAETTLAINGYDFPMTPIDLFSLQWFGGNGPALLSPGRKTFVDLRPYGFTLHKVGAIDHAGTMQLVFSSPVAPAEKLYILAQPY